MLNNIYSRLISLILINILSHLLQFSKLIAFPFAHTNCIQCNFTIYKTFRGPNIFIRALLYISLTDVICENEDYMCFDALTYACVVQFYGFHFNRNVIHVRTMSHEKVIAIVILSNSSDSHYACARKRPASNLSALRVCPVSRSQRLVRV